MVNGFLFLRYRMRIRYFRIGRLVACMPLGIGCHRLHANCSSPIKAGSAAAKPKVNAAAPGTIYSLEQLIQLALESNPRVLAARDQAAAC
jgi:hypothetical protein